MIPLEDQFHDIIGKALRGLQVSDAALATAAGIAPEAVKALRSGTWDEVIARKVAPTLGLDAESLTAAGKGIWQPAPLVLEGLAQFNTPFDDMTVNSYLVWDAASGVAAAFDTGADCSGVLELLAEKKLTLQLILLTHTHGDHVFDLDRLREKTGAVAFVNDREPFEGAQGFSAGTTWNIGPLKIESRLTWGHSPGGITFVVTGLARPLALVGDAIFAGSMGGGGISYEAALQTTRDQILTLPGETILGPGHGPLTTVADERSHNPFFAA